MKAPSEYETYKSNPAEHVFQQVELRETEKLKEEKKFLCKKYIEKGSLAECIINLCIISFGIGLLALPQKVNYLTLIMTPILIIIFGIINCWTFSVLSDASRQFNVNKYEDIVYTLFNPCFTYFFIIVVGIGLCGIMILFQVILYKFIGGVINELFSFGYNNMEDFARESFWGRKKIRLIVCFSIAAVILFPICLIKTFSKLRYVTTFGVFSVFAIIIIIIIQCPSFYKNNVIKKKQKLNIFDFSYGFNYNLKFIQSISTIIYSYACHAGVLPVISGLDNPIRERVQKVFISSTTINIICYTIITLCGYLSQPENTPDLILEREKISKKDYLMTVGLILFSITLITKIVSTYNVLRSLLLNLFKFDSINFPNSINFILTIITLAVTTFVAAMFQNISDCININGAFYGLFIAVIMPGIIYIKTNNYSLYHIKNILAIIFIVILSCIGGVTIFFTFKRIFGF